jgi:AraC-like DNA-binding protein
MPHPDLWDIPDLAIRSFERQTGLAVTVHDLEIPLGPFLPPERFKHGSPCCAAVKATRDWACVDFEITRLRGEILKFPEGRYHACHAGFMEWVVPGVVQNRLAWILFAGQARAAGDYRHLLRDTRRTHPFPPSAARLRGVSETEAELLLEALRQLRSRLAEWHGQMTATLPAPAARRGKQGPGLASRRLQIQDFLLHHHKARAPVRALARHLGLSESRTTHLVRELFGCSAIQLANRMRLRAAASLLRGSSLPVLEVCLGSGFQDVSHFHRAFRKEFGATPLQYRRDARA